MPSPAVRLRVRNSSTVGSSAAIRASRRRAPRCSSPSRGATTPSAAATTGTASRTTAAARRTRRERRDERRRDGERRRPPTPVARPRNRSTVDGDPAWRSRRAMASLPPSTRDERRARSRDAGRPAPEHRARIGGSAGEQLPRASAEMSATYGATRSTSRGRPSRGIAATTSQQPEPERRAPSSHARRRAALIGTTAAPRAAGRARASPGRRRAYHEPATMSTVPAAVS